MLGGWRYAGTLSNLPFKTSGEVDSENVSDYGLFTQDRIYRTERNLSTVPLLKWYCPCMSAIFTRLFEGVRVQGSGVMIMG